MTQPFSDCPTERKARASRLYFDVDDTLTWQGRLPEDAVGALYRAHEAGISLVAVTGRSASWGEMLLRLLPLDAVVAETGALCFFHRKAGGVEVLHSEPSAEQREKNDERRRAAARRVLAEVKEARLALDNMGRVYDTAFDLIEDGPPVGPAEAWRIRSILGEEGLTVAQSSVHINAWFGAFDKATMVDAYLREVEGTSLVEAAPTLVYAGDSKNDGVMFAATDLSVGVANVRPHLDDLGALGQAPAWIVQGEGGLGFAELVEELLEARFEAGPAGRAGGAV